MKYTCQRCPMCGDFLELIAENVAKCIRCEKRFPLILSEEEQDGQTYTDDANSSTQSSSDADSDKSKPLPDVNMIFCPHCGKGKRRTNYSRTSPQVHQCEYCMHIFNTIDGKPVTGSKRFRIRQLRKFIGSKARCEICGGLTTEQHAARDSDLSDLAMKCRECGHITHIPVDVATA